MPVSVCMDKQMNVLDPYNGILFGQKKEVQIPAVIGPTPKHAK